MILNSSVLKLITGTYGSNISPEVVKLSGLYSKLTGGAIPSLAAFDRLSSAVSLNSSLILSKSGKLTFKK
jgi:hypothetical protein